MITGSNKGFTLIEVLLALAVIAIAMTALLKATAENISGTTRLKDKTISHWVAMQGIAAVQTGILNLNPGQEITQVTSILGQAWYWRVKITDAPVESMQKITVTLSKNQSGPFTDPHTAFRYKP